MEQRDGWMAATRQVFFSSIQQEYKMIPGPLFFTFASSKPIHTNDIPPPPKKTFSQFVAWTISPPFGKWSRLGQHTVSKLQIWLLIFTKIFIKN
jgi:hypothetical protein